MMALDAYGDKNMAEYMLNWYGAPRGFIKKWGEHHGYKITYRVVKR
jgi:hypothetical protein